VQAFDPWLPDSHIRKAGVEPATLPELLEKSDVIFVLAISTPENKGMLTRSLLERVKPGAVFVLISRSHLVDFDALVDLVEAGRFRLAADVFPVEPVEPDNPVRKLQHAVLTPHIAGSVREDTWGIGAGVVDDIEAISRGIPPKAMQAATFELIDKL
jgi:phosphoglycerate dehydrogenase-like enzyme